MIISICPECNKKGEIIKGRFLNTVAITSPVNTMYQYYSVYQCEKCKSSYTEK